MKDRRAPVCSRRAPGAERPAWSKDTRTASSSPNSRKAAAIDTSVRIVRSLRRNSDAQTRCRYFMADSLGPSAAHQRALVQVQGLARKLSRLGIVRHDDDGLAMFPIQDLQQAQHFLGR